MTRAWLLIQLLCYWKGLTGNNGMVFKAESWSEPVAVISVQVLALKSQQIFGDARIKGD